MPAPHELWARIVWAAIDMAELGGLDGDANKDIAAALGCAENTVELHVTALLRRVTVSSRTQLVARFWSETWT